MPNVHDLAAYLTETAGPLGTMKLEKLVYYCQGWHLARIGSPLFTEELEAWKMGPVSRDLYACHRRENSVTSWPWGNSSKLNVTQRSLVDAVVDVYGVYSGFQLGQMTHQERPWNIARARGLNTVISRSDMEDWFKEIDATPIEND